MRYRKLTQCLLAVALIAPAAETQADQNDAIPSITITPKKNAQESAANPASITVIEKTEMEEKGMAQIQDALEDIPGIRLSRSDTPGGFSSIFMRGTETSHTLVLLDGMPINDPSITTGAFNFSEDVLGEISRVEIERGPGAVEYGSAAIGGVINLITLKPAPTSFSSKLETYGGSSGTLGGQSLISGTSDSLNYLASIEGHHSDGFNTLPARFPNNPKDPKGSDTETLFGKLGYTIDPSTRLKAQIRYRNSEFELNDQAVSTPAYFGKSAALIWQVQGERDWSSRDAKASLAVGQTRTDRSYRNDPDAADIAAGSSWLRAAYAGTRTSINANNVFHIKGTENLTNIVLKTGLTFAKDTSDIDYQSNGLYGPFSQTANASMTETGAFAKLQFRTFDRIDLTAGARADFPEGYASRGTPYLGGVLQLPEISARIKSSYGASFRTPSLFERYGVDNYGLVGNPTLLAETAKSWDAGFEKDVRVFEVSEALGFGATYFETSTNNLIQYEFGPTPQYRNVGRAEISGTETRLNISPYPWMEAEATWTWLRAINASGDVFSGTPPGGELLRRPKHTASASITVRPSPDWRITPKLRFVGPQYDQLYNDSGVFTGRGRVGGYTLADVSTDYRITEKVSAYIRVRNVLNRTVESPNGYLLEPLTVLVGLRYD